MTIRIKFAQKYRYASIECRLSEMKQILRGPMVVHTSMNKVRILLVLRDHYLFCDEEAVT